MKSVIKSIRNISQDSKLVVKGASNACHKAGKKRFEQYSLPKEHISKVKGGLVVTDMQGL